MAEGNITRIVGGKNIIETEEWVVYTDKFTAYAGKGSHFTADGGTKLGNPKSAPSIGHYFKNAWWSSDREGNKKITKAKVGDTVYFQVEMTEKFPQKSLPLEKQQKFTFTLYEFTGYKYSVGYMYIFGPSLYLDKEPKKENEIKYVSWDDKNKNKRIDKEEEYSKKPYNEETANGNKAVIKFQLSDALSSYLREFAELKLFMSLNYDGEIIDLPEDENLYLEVFNKPFPLKMHQRSFAPWEKFGNLIFDNLRQNNFYGDGRSFSLIDNFLESVEDDLELRYKKLKESGKVTSRLYQKIEFDYNENGVKEDETIGICNITRGQWFFAPFDFATGSKINETPTHTEYYGEHSLLNSSMEKGVVNMNIEGSDPMVVPAPDIDWKLLVRLKFDMDKKLLNIKGVALGKEFPAYEAFIEDSHGTRFFLHTYTPLNELELTGELIWNAPDYFGNIDITIEIDVDENGYYFKNIIKSALFTYSQLIKEDSYIEKVYENITLEIWNQMHLNKKTSKDL